MRGLLRSWLYVPTLLAMSLVTQESVALNSRDKWYVRGEVGLGMPFTFRNSVLDSVSKVNQMGSYDFYQHSKSGTAPIFGLGIGYQVSKYFRIDLLGNYFSNSSYNTANSSLNSSGRLGLKVGDGMYTAGDDNLFHVKQSISSAYLMINSYLIAPISSKFELFSLGGIGESINYSGTMLATQNIAGGTSIAYGRNSLKNFAYTLGCGMSYRVTDALAVEFTYKYVNLGRLKTKDGVMSGAEDMTIPAYSTKLQLNAISFGLRYHF